MNLIRTIAIDFDGTLCENKWPDIGKPKMDVINKAIEEKKNGSELILWTNRTGKLLQNAIDWCLTFGLQFNNINDSTDNWKKMFSTDPRKVGATEYWDDKSWNPEKEVKFYFCNECDFWIREKQAGKESLGNVTCPCGNWSDIENGRYVFTKPTDFCSCGYPIVSNG